MCHTSTQCEYIIFVIVYHWHAFFFHFRRARAQLKPALGTVKNNNYQTFAVAHRYYGIISCTFPVGPESRKLLREKIERIARFPKNVISVLLLYIVHNTISYDLMSSSSRPLLDSDRSIIIHKTHNIYHPITFCTRVSAACSPGTKKSHVPGIQKDFHINTKTL